MNNKIHNLFCLIFLFLFFSIKISQVSASYTMEFHESVTVGAIFEWKVVVRKTDMESILEDYWTQVKEGDIIKAKVNKVPDESNTFNFECGCGLSNFFLNFSVNNLEVNSSDISVLEPTYYGYIYPLSLNNDTGTYNYLEYLFNEASTFLENTDIFEKKITNRFALMIYDKQIDNEYVGGYFYKILKYDKKTGFLVEYTETNVWYKLNGEDIDLSFNVSLELISSVKASYNFCTTSILILVCLSIAIVRKRRESCVN